jgi:glyoxylase-like metal-dependent hydrolase (beta-lactamase superfamily II)
VFARETGAQQIADGVVRLGTDVVNWYLVEQDGKVTVVDAGAPAYRPQLEPGLRKLGRQPSDVEAIVLTHAHADHIGVAEKLRTELGIPVHVHSDDEQLATTRKAFGKNEASVLPYLRHGAAWKLLAHLTTSGGVPPKIERVETFEDKQELDVPGRPRVIHTPGHTMGHVAFHVPSRGVVFAGDLLCSWNPLTGARGPQLMPSAFNLSSAKMLDSLTKIQDLDAGFVLFGHGEPWNEGPRAAVERARSTGPT